MHVVFLYVRVRKREVIKVGIAGSADLCGACRVQFYEVRKNDLSAGTAQHMGKAFGVGGNSVGLFLVVHLVGQPAVIDRFPANIVAFGPEGKPKCLILLVGPKNTKFELLFTAKDSPSFSFVIWFIFIGVSYIVGHAGQTALEVLGLLSAHPYPKWRLGKVHEKGKMAREKFANRLTALKGDKIPKGQLDQRERYIIIKDMTGNLILPCFVIGITVLLFKSWVWCLFFLLTSGVMWVSHAAHRRRQYELEVRILKGQNSLNIADFQMD